MPPRTNRAASTRHRIERAALHHFVEQGIAETSIRDIARTAEISLGAMYNHFASKEELAWNLFYGGWAELAREMRDGARPHHNFPARMRAVVRHLFTRFDEDWEFMTYVFVSRHLHLKRVPPARVNPYTVFRMLIREAMRKGEIPANDPDLATSLLIGGVIQAIDSAILGRIKGPLRHHADAAANMCVRMLGG